MSEVQRVVGKAEQGKRRQWFLMGEQLSPKCCTAILGMGNARMFRVEQGRGDRRYQIWGAATYLIVNLVSYCFYLFLYVSLLWFDLFPCHAKDTGPRQGGDAQLRPRKFISSFLASTSKRQDGKKLTVILGEYANNSDSCLPRITLNIETKPVPQF